VSGGDDIGRRVNRAVAWVGLASAIVAGFDAITLALLMWQWVSQTDLGIATYAVTVFYFLDLATEAGLSSVLIQRETLDDDTASSVFWLNVIVSGVVFLLLLGVAPAIAYLQDEPIVTWMLLAYGTKLFYQNVYFVPNALLRREMRFRELSIVRTVANAGDSITKLAFAAAGEPIWCFVAGPLARVLITGIGIQLYRPWRPKRVFRRDQARAWLTFGFKTTGSQYLQHFYNNIGYQIVGVYFGEAAVGVYRVAYELVLYPINWINNVVTQVAFPAFARLRAEPAALAEQFRRFSRQNVATALPLLVLILAAAPEILAVVFPNVDGGAGAARLLCVVGLLRAIDCLYLPLLDGLGRAGRNFGVAAIAAVLLTTLDIVFAATLGPSLGYVSVAIARIVGYPIVIAIHMYMALAALRIGPGRYLRELLALIVCGAIAVVPALAVAEVMPAASAVVRLVVIGLTAEAALLVLFGSLHGLWPNAIVRELKR
jgi:O-antigen/teichoic acid export membrane protein